MQVLPSPSVTAAEEAAGSDRSRHGEHPGASVKLGWMPLAGHVSNQRPL
jgi:hypothetical protein